MFNNYGNHGTSTYFNNFNSSSEQQVLEDLIIESIKIYGQDLIYIPRQIVSKDELFTEDDQSKYSDYYPIEMYIKSVDGFEGDGVFLSKFGLEIRDQITFTVAKRIFNQEVTKENSQERPNEGDLIYSSMLNKIFQIKYVNYKPFFYQLGALQTYDIVCELFEYSSEIFDTGIEEIDVIQTKFSTNILDHAILDENGEFITDENGEYLIDESFRLTSLNTNADNEFIQTEENIGTETDQQNNLFTSNGSSTPTSSNNNIVDWTDINPFSENRF